MASTPSSIQTINGDKDGGGSYFQKTVCLYDWWLIKAQNDDALGKRLAVGGVTAREKQARRVFSSAPIAKRFDVFTLETADGICVAIKGFINKQKTTENGFPSEVFNHFLFGFPPDWEQYVEKFLGGNSPPTCAVSGSSSYSDKLPNHPGSTKSSIPTSVHVDQEETPVEQVSCEDRPDAEVPKQFSSKLTTNVVVDDSEVNDLPKHAAEEETGRINIGASDFQSIGRQKHLGSKQKKPVSRCFMKRKHTNSSPASEVFDSKTLSTSLQNDNRKGGRSMSRPAGRVTRTLSGNLRSKGKEKQMVGSGLNSERNTVDSVPAVSKTLSKSLEKDNRKLGGRSMSRPSDSELPEPNDLNVKNKLDFGQLEDDLPHTCNAKQGQKCGNIAAQVGEEGSDAKEENASRKRAKRQTTFDTEVTPTLEVNKKVSPPALNLRLSRSVGEGGSDAKEENTSRKKPKRKTIFDTEETPTVEVNKKVSIASPESLNLRRSRSVGGGGSDAKEENTARKLPKSKTTFDTEETPNVEVNEKVTIASPESLNLRRSRSGRLLVPTMEFWRNQVAIYDLDRTVTGIQQSLPVVTTSRGSRSESQKSKRQR